MCHILVLLVLAGVCVEAKFHPFEVVLEVLELLEVAEASPLLLLEVLVVFGVLQLSPQQPRALRWLPLDVDQDLVHHHTAPTMPLQFPAETYISPVQDPTTYVVVLVHLVSNLVQVGLVAAIVVLEDGHVVLVVAPLVDNPLVDASGNHLNNSLSIHQRNRVVEVPAKDLVVELLLVELDVGPCHVPPPPSSLFAPSAWLLHLIEDGEEDWEDAVPLPAS